MEVKRGGFEVNGKFVKVSAERDQNKSTGARRSVVLEATGFFAKKSPNTYAGGAKKGLLSLLLVETTLKTVGINTNHDILDGTENSSPGASCTKLLGTNG